jgi:hypothetical protein
VNRQITVAQTLRARRRAFGATDWRTAPTAVDYTQFTDPELTQARAEVLEALQGENSTDEDATRADAIAVEIERRNTITTATNERRQRLANVTVVDRWRSDSSAPPNGPGTRGQRPPENQTEEELAVPRDWRSQLATGAATYRERGMTGSAEILRLPNATDLRALVTTTTWPSSPDRLPGIVHAPDQILKVADLLDQQTATSGSIEWVVESVSTYPATEVGKVWPSPRPRPGSW